MSSDETETVTVKKTALKEIINEIRAIKNLVKGEKKP